MRMHYMKQSLLALALFLGMSTVQAADISQQEAAGGLKEALTRSAGTAVKQLGQADGFLGNEKVRIPLPPALKNAESLMRTFGMGKQADDLVVSMNRAAEAAVPQAKTLLVDAVKKMTLDDAKAILSGGDDAATRYFRKHTEAKLTRQFLPIVKQSTDRVGLAQRYNDFAGKAAQFGLASEQDAKIENYVTRKALDGLYLVIAEQERAIRKDPLGFGGKLIGKVFGSLL